MARKRKLSRAQQLNGWAFDCMESISHGHALKVNVLGRVLHGPIVVQRNDIPVPKTPGTNADNPDYSSMRYKIRCQTGEEWFNLNDVEGLAKA